MTYGHDAAHAGDLFAMKNESGSYLLILIFQRIKLGKLVIIMAETDLGRQPKCVGGGRAVFLGLDQDPPTGSHSWETSNPIYFLLLWIWSLLKEWKSLTLHN